MSLVNDIAWEENKAFVGETVEVLVASGEGRKDGQTDRASGRAQDNRLVHVNVGDGEPPAPGDIVRARVTYAAPHHLVADEVLEVVRRERAHSGESLASGVGLGMPSIGPPRS